MKNPIYKIAKKLYEPYSNLWKRIKLWEDLKKELEDYQERWKKGKVSDSDLIDLYDRYIQRIEKLE